MNLEQAYGNLTLDQSVTIDLDNKTASFDAMSKIEFTTMVKTNKHKVYRLWRCIWCAKELSFVSCTREGKGKDYCNVYCAKRHAYFRDRIKGKSKAVALKTIEAQIFMEYCLANMITRQSVEKLNEMLKRITRQPTILAPMIVKEKKKGVMK